VTTNANKNAVTNARIRYVLLVSGALAEGTRGQSFAILSADLTGQIRPSANKKLKTLHQQSDHAGDHERCGPYPVEIQPGLA